MSEIEQDSPNFISQQRQALAERDGKRINDPRKCNAALRTFMCEFYCELPEGHIGLHCVRETSRDDAQYVLVWDRTPIKHVNVTHEPTKHIIPTMQQDVPEVAGVMTTSPNAGDMYTPMPPVGTTPIRGIK